MNLGYTDDQHQARIICIVPASTSPMGRSLPGIYEIHCSCGYVRSVSGSAGLAAHHLDQHVTAEDTDRV